MLYYYYKVITYSHLLQMQRVHEITGESRGQEGIQLLSPQDLDLRCHDEPEHQCDNVNTTIYTPLNLLLHISIGKCQLLLSPRTRTVKLLCGVLRDSIKFTIMKNIFGFPHSIRFSNSFFSSIYRRRQTNRRATDERWLLSTAAPEKLAIRYHS